MSAKSNKANKIIVNESHMPAPSYDYENLAYHLYAQHDNLIEKLVHIRERHHISINELAERMNIDADTIRTFESDMEDQTLTFIMDYALEIGADMWIEVKDANKRSQS